MAERLPSDGSDGGESDDTSVNDVEDEVLEFSISTGAGSVYEDAFFVPLLVAAQKKDGPKVHSLRGARFLYGLLAINFCLQISMSLKLHYVTLNDLQETMTDLFDMCQKTTLTEYCSMDRWGPCNISQTIDAEQTFYDCATLASTLFLRPRMLDLNNDGQWTRQEVQPLQKRLSRSFGSNIHLDTIMDSAVDIMGIGDRFISEKYTSIPISWFEERAGWLRLCIPHDARLCGNFEERGLLKDLFPDKDEAGTRIAGCEKVVTGFCPKLFGERYKWYAAQSSQTCGSPSVEWDDDHWLRQTHYDEVQKLYSNSDAAVTSQFMFFLMLILTLWFTLMIKELRDIIEFANVLLKVKTRSRESRECVQISDDGSWKVVALPRRSKLIAWLAILLPRIVIFVAVVYVGTRFLSYTDGYVDLLLNSTALGFVIEIDQMLHLAFVSSTIQRKLEDTCDLVVRENPPSCMSKLCKATWVYLLILAIVVGSWSYYIYFSAHGKLDVGRAMACFCELDGQDCIGWMHMKNSVF